jgi:hypothetical protein
MKMTKILVFVLILSAMFLASLPAQEALLSDTERYYDFLALQGLTERPYLNYRTLSDSMWEIEEGATHPWQGQNLGTTRNIFGDVSMRIYGPELFSSFNSAAPYGQNDGVLWQGKGFNSSFTGGVRFEGHGLELTFKPQLAFSQNLAFDYITPNYSGDNYAGKAGTYGYFWGTVDSPQRFGNEPFFSFDWNDTEIRYSWQTFTIGLGNQSMWLGPAYLNSMLHSNNASTYPKFDIGMRRQSISMPWVNWYLGDIEFRIWIGYLSESKYFDNNNENDHNMFHGLSLSYAPSFLPGLTVFANRVCIVPWEWENIKYVFPEHKNTIEDQKMSLGMSYLLPQSGIEIYGELGIDDYTLGGLKGYLRYPFHTMIYTVGLKKILDIVPQKAIYGEIIFEWNSMEMSQDFQFQWPYSPYSHGLIKQGYTNQGQWLGAGSGWGGSSQYLEFRLYYSKGTSSIFIHRNNPDNNFLYSKAVEAAATKDNLEEQYYTSWKANFIIGMDTNYFLLKFLKLGVGLGYNIIINPYYRYEKTDFYEDYYTHNLFAQFRIQLQY